MTNLGQATETLLRDLIAFPTVSSDSNRAMIDALANRLEDAGARVNIHAHPTEAKANLFATLGPETGGGIVLSGHTDVVPVADQSWTSDPFTMTQRGDRLFGRGTCDMKGFIAATVAVAEARRDQTLSRPIHFAFTHDEEVGCLGAQALVKALDAEGIRPEIVIVGEPTEMKMIEGHKGCCEYTTRVTGLEGHGSQPDLGVNAVVYACRIIAELLSLADALKTRAPENSAFDPPWSTINIGALHGGTTQNVIPGKAAIDWEMRPVRWEDADFVKSALDQHIETVLLPEMRAVYPDADIRTETIGEVIGLLPEPQSAARALVAALTGRDEAGLVSFGTEAGLFQSLGASVIVCGPGSIRQAHKPDEYIDRSELAACIDMLSRLWEGVAT